MAALLAPALHVEIATSANFEIEETLYNNIFYGESAVFSGDGVDDLDKIITRMNRNQSIVPRPFYQIFVGRSETSGTTRWYQLNVEDVQAIRAAFVVIYGEISHPTVFD